VKRAEIWTVAGGAEYTGKPRPAVIVQDDRFDTDSVTICPFTSDSTEAPLFRLSIVHSPTNGLRETSQLMVDKLTTIRRSRLRDRLGVLDGAELVRLNRAIVVFLGITSSA
jgi:mRNA interferase MazF